MAKRIITGGLGLLLLTVSYATVSAQIPNIQAYFCPSQQSDVCQGVGVSSQLCVYANNFNAWVQGVEFAIAYPLAITWVSDVVSPFDALVIGDTPNGVAVTYGPVPQNGYVSFLIMRVNVTWNCDECGPASMDNPITVVPEPVGEFLGIIRWPDNVRISGIGMTSLICSSLPVEPSTWGRVKALYTE